MRLDSYPSYKQSGISWCEDIPLGWDVQPLYALANECSSSNKGMIEDNLLSLSYGKVINKDINSNDGLLPESFETYQVVEVDDIVLRLTDLQNDKRSLRSAIVKERGIITSAYLAIRPKKIDARFLNYLLRAYDLTKVFYSMGGGLRQSMKFSDVRRLPLILPSLLEQKSIATFLDHETAKIDTLVAAQVNLIALMKEKRQALITKAVTKGINPKVKMKDSGVAWLGEVPEHWEVTKIKYIATASNGLTYSPDDLVDSDDGVLVLRSSNIQQGKISLEDNVYVKMNIPSKSVVKSGDILICSRNGSRALIGKNALIPDSLNGVAYGAFMMLLRSDISRYIYWILNSFIFEFQSSLFLTSTINQLTVSDLYGFEVPIPPKSEQGEIIKYLQNTNEKLNSLIDNATKSVALLQERRSALISAAVTGQIDVRDYQVKEAA